MWVTSKPGEIKIRNKRIEKLVEYPFLEVSNFLIHGDNPGFIRNTSWKHCIETSFEALKKNKGIFKNRTILEQYHIKELIDEVLNKLESRYKANKSNKTNLISQIVFTWLAILSEIALFYDEHWWPSNTKKIIYAFMNALSNQELPLNDDQYNAGNAHMTLQIESPESPSSLSVRKAVNDGASLYDALRVGLKNFWVSNHGLASKDLASLLLKWQKDEVIIEIEIDSLLKKRIKIPGFGSHAHKGAVDPRMATYKKYTEIIKGQDWLWQTAEKLKNFLEARKSLKPNPDYYMALMHYEMGIKPDRIPLTFLVSRMVGWSATYLEQKLKKV